ncbi:MAG: AMP-binding protein, partial [Clostridiales bacterium]|nr:AMP-binding protein [Clostridiales bacterium]
MEFTEKTIGQILKGLAEKYPDATAVKYTDRDFHLTWKQLDELTDKLAKGLMALGIEKDDKVAIWATNVPEWHLTLFAAVKIGAVLVTVNTNYKIFEMEYLLKQSDTKALVMTGGFRDSDYVKIINELLPGLSSSDGGNVNDKRFPELKQVLFAGKNPPQGMLSFWDLTDLGGGVSDSEYAARVNGLTCHDVINMQYTSGTTGFPKGVMLTHYNILNNGVATGDAMRLTEKDKICICVPLFHCFGLVLATMSAITHAVAMIPVDFFGAVPVMKAIESERCTVVHGVPTMFISMLEHPDFKKYNLSSLRTGIMAGSPCPIKVMQQVADEMYMKDIIIVFGQTESSPG